MGGFALSRGIIATEREARALPSRRRGFSPQSGEDPAGSCRSEMAERRARKDKRLTVHANKARSPLPRRHHANLADRHAGRRCLLTQRLLLVRWNARQKLIVVAAGEDRLDQRRLLGEGCARASGER